ncbi:MAG: hypothetical protein QM796_21410 [Chthoniobacteraceae bacterium]
MKIRSLFAIALGMFTSSASARIGETAEQILTRYGQGKKVEDRLIATGAETWKYDKGDFNIEVVFINGVSAWEIFSRKGKLLSDDDIKDLLKVNTIEATSWRYDRRENRWERGGRPKLFAYKEPGHPEQFSIRDPALIEAAEKKNEIEKSGF